jgi:hypothetical protein
LRHSVRDRKEEEEDDDDDDEEDEDEDEADEDDEDEEDEEYVSHNEHFAIVVNKSCTSNSLNDLAANL